MDASSPSGGGSVSLVRAWCTWWLVCAALWMVLDDTVAVPELVDGAVAATIGACAATVVLAGTPLRLALRPTWLRHWWRPWAQLVTGLPVLVRVLFVALARGDRDPGELRSVPFALHPDPAARAGQVALASVAGSVASGAVIVAVDEVPGTLLVHEISPRADRRWADPLELGGRS